MRKLKFKLQNLYFLIVFIIATTHSNGQDSNSIKIIRGLNTYRELYLFNRGLFDTSFFQLATKLDDINTAMSPGLLMELIYAYCKMVDGNYLEMSKNLKRNYGVDLKGINFLPTDLEVVNRHGHFLNMMSNGFIDVEAPYKLIYDTTLYEELKFCHLNPNDKMVDIGAGDGFFSILLGLIYQNQSIVLTELNPNLVRFMRNDLEFLKKYNLPFMWSLVDGYDTNTGVEHLIFDKILIRQSFHHFRKKNDMLNSIIKSMDNRTELIIIEHLNKPKFIKEDDFNKKDKDNHIDLKKDSIQTDTALMCNDKDNSNEKEEEYIDYDQCKKRISAKSFLKYLSKNNLVIIEIKKLDDSYAFRIKKRS